MITLINSIKNKLHLNATTIKITAIALMVFDHIFQMFNPIGAPIWLHWLGRPVFPMFLFAMAESFYYTSNRKKFLTRLLLAAWFMIIFNTLLQALLPNPNPSVVLGNNAFMTFFVVGLYMWFWDMLIDGIKTKSAKKIIGSILLCFVPVITALPAIWIGSLAKYDAATGAMTYVIPFAVMRVLLTISMMIPSIVLAEAGFTMVTLGTLFYILRKWRWAQIVVLIAFSALAFILGKGRDLSNQWLMILAVIPMLLYNGEKGRGMKYFFYIFYPAHVYLLYIIATLWK